MSTRGLVGVALVAALGCGAKDTTGSIAAELDGGGTCSAEQQLCGERCVDVRADNEHCGACGNGCAESETCQGGLCEACTATAAEASSAVLPADIIVVVDNSPSMVDEAKFVQDSMNAFVAALTTSGIDAHVILISEDSGDLEGICVPAPLGSGSCPSDENLPLYRHVVHSVSSSAGLTSILGTYDQFKSSLRDGASRSIVVISDDDSSMSASDFAAQMVAKDPSFEGFTFGAIVAPYELNPLVCFPCVGGGSCASCDPCCGPDTFTGTSCTALPADEGVEYKQLVADTGGVLGNLCTQDFGPVFDDVATAVIQDSLVPCSYLIPDPPEGGSINFSRVNVELRPTAQDDYQVVPYVGDEGSCGAAGGWYYDDAASPEQILFCPVTCTEAQASNEAAVNIKLGCSTISL